MGIWRGWAGLQLQDKPQALLVRKEMLSADALPHKATTQVAVLLRQTEGQLPSPPSTTGAPRLSPMVLACCGMIICVMCAAVSEGRIRRLRPSGAPFSPTRKSAGGTVGALSLWVMGCSRHSASCRAPATNRLPVRPEG